MKRLLAIALVTASSTAAAGSVVGSKHDLSTKGPGPYRATTESDACIFCHVSHNSGKMALSNRPDPTVEHRPYESTTLSSRPGAPTGSSRLCLSCHDGTIAVGHTLRGDIAMENGNRPIGPGRRANLGTDLRATHPISIPSPPAGKVHAPPRGDAVRLDAAGLVQCTSCHDPHDEWRDSAVGKFLVKPSANSAICASCHTAGSGLTAATHLRPAIRTLGKKSLVLSKLSAPEIERGVEIAPTGCGACHTTHGADVRGRLLQDGVQEDDACLPCHADAGEKPLGSDLRKAYAHVTPNRGRHDAAEGPAAEDSRRLPEVSRGAARHVTCVDCHDPHSSTPLPSVAPAAPGALAGVWGIDLDGQRVAAVRYEYEVCLKCHGDSVNQPQRTSPGAFSRVRRADPDVNLRLVFGRDAASAHPVAFAGRSARVPSLRPPYSAGSFIFCTDCHASDGGPGAGGRGARGPHGSVYPFLLERQYLTDDFTPEGPASYALCYKCHDREVLLSDRTAAEGGSTFPLHRRHVLDRSTPCSACHAAHGVSALAGNPRNNAHLVSFDLAIAKAGGAGAPRYETSGFGHGSCTLTCHDVSHGPGSVSARAHAVSGTY